MNISKEEIKLLSRHRSDAGLLSYTLPTDNKKNEIIGQFMNKIHGKSISGIKKLFNTNYLLVWLRNANIWLLDETKLPAEGVNNQDLCNINENKQINGKEHNDFKTAKEGKITFINLPILNLLAQ